MVAKEKADNSVSTFIEITHMNQPLDDPLVRRRPGKGLHMRARLAWAKLRPGNAGNIFLQLVTQHYCVR